MSGWLEKEVRWSSVKLLVVNLFLAALAGVAVAAAAEMGRSTGNTDNITVALIAVSAGALLYFLWNSVQAVRRYFRIQASPTWKQLKAFGNPEQLAAQIDQEQQAEPTRVGRKIRITQSWISRRGAFKTWLGPLSDVVWVYKKETKRYRNTTYTGSTYSVMIVGRRQNWIRMPMSEKKADALMSVLNSNVPWAIFGYSKDVAKAWRTDSASLIATVDARQRQHRSNSASDTAATPGPKEVWTNPNNPQQTRRVGF